MDILGQSALIVSVTSIALGVTALSRNLRNKLVQAYSLLCGVIGAWALCFFLEKNKGHAIEMGIFTVISLIFFNSVYQLFSDGKFSGEVARQTIEVKPSGRSLASKSTESGPNVSIENIATSGSSSPYETLCKPSGELLETQAAKIRIVGPFCGHPTHLAQPKTNTETETIDSDANLKIENSRNKFAATVFSDFENGKFSTDFIPVEVGTNKIIMEFQYKKSRKVFPVEVIVVRK